ncbi:MAG: Ig-like domain-containing protein [Planctomycetes bacterium]|jgi:Tol biopolymer transport system component|nr:Ig-like domain-containing protein [Planctomycetota bacterium]
MQTTSASSLVVLLLLGACGGSGGGAPDDTIPVSSSLSVVTLQASQAIASDGVDGAPLVVTLRDENGQLLVGRQLTVAATGSGNDFVPAASLRTGTDGTARVRLTSTSPERKQLTVTVTNAGVAAELPNRPEVDFVPTNVARRRVSVSSSGAQGNDFSRQAAVSGNGRYVGFQSKASNLVSGDSNQKEDVFVHDRDTGATERISLRPSGGQFADLCGMPSLSDDGLFVAFEGRATDTDAVFVRDRIAGLTEPISGATSLGGRCFAPSLSGDGRWVAFVCATGESQQVYVYDRVADAVQLVSRSSGGAAGNGPSMQPSISRDGRWIAFASESSNLVGDDSNDKIDVFVHDRTSGQTRRVSTSSGGDEGNDDSVEPAISADGTRVAFASKAANLVSGDDNGKSDVFVHTLATGATIRVSVNPQGNEVDKESWLPKLSADGSYVAFSSLSDDLVGDDRNGKEDVFCRDLVSGVTRRVSLARGGGDPDDDCTAPALASDAPVIAFVSKAKNMVQGDSNDQDDVFVAPRGN